MFAHSAPIRPDGKLFGFENSEQPYAIRWAIPWVVRTADYKKMAEILENFPGEGV